MREREKLQGEEKMEGREETWESKMRRGERSDTLEQGEKEREKERERRGERRDN